MESSDTQMSSDSWWAPTRHSLGRKGDDSLPVTHHDTCLFGTQVPYGNLKKNDYHIACACLGEEFAFHAKAMKIAVFDHVKCHVVATRLKDANLLDDHLNTFEYYHVPPSSPLVQLSLVHNHKDYQEAIDEVKKMFGSATNPPLPHPSPNPDGVQRVFMKKPEDVEKSYIPCFSLQQDMAYPLKEVSRILLLVLNLPLGLLLTMKSLKWMAI